jgi:hypothetical protein
MWAERSRRQKGKMSGQGSCQSLHTCPQVSCADSSTECVRACHLRMLRVPYVHLRAGARGIGVWRIICQDYSHHRAPDDNHTGTLSPASHRDSSNRHSSFLCAACEMLCYVILPPVHANAHLSSCASPFNTPLAHANQTSHSPLIIDSHTEG